MWGEPETNLKQNIACFFIVLYKETVSKRTAIDTKILTINILTQIENICSESNLPTLSRHHQNGRLHSRAAHTVTC